MTRTKERCDRSIEFVYSGQCQWFEGSGIIRKALVEVLTRIPECEFDTIVDDICLYILDGTNSAAWCFHFPCPPHNDLRKHTIRVVVLRPKLRELPYKHVVAEIAHELAHVVLEHEVLGGEEQQSEADNLVISWGFDNELRQYYEHSDTARRQ